MKTLYKCDYCHQNLIYVQDVPEEDNFVQICIDRDLIYLSEKNDNYLSGLKNPKLIFYSFTNLLEEVM